MDASLGERLASALLSYIEEPEPKAPAQHRPKATRNIEAELLQGGSVVAAASSPQAAAKPQSELEMLHADVARLLQQREQLTARLIAEQERRERAEAELVSLGAQWLGTETQQALQERAESERRRVLDAEREAIRREAEQRISKAEAQATMLREKLGKDAPTQMQLRMQLRAALRAELEHERSEARAAVEQQLSALTSERDGLAAELRRAEATHKIELKALARSVRQAAQMLQEQYDKGFVSGLQQAAQALGATDAVTTKPSAADPPPNTSQGAVPSDPPLEHPRGDDINKEGIDAARDDRQAADEVDVNDDDKVSDDHHADSDGKPPSISEDATSGEGSLVAPPLDESSESSSGSGDDDDVGGGGGGATNSNTTADEDVDAAVDKQAREDGRGVHITSVAEQGAGCVESLPQNECSSDAG
jgi:hypothetical protein